MPRIVGKDVHVAVAGGGAAGLVCAIAAAQEGASVTVFEAADRVGKKILKTGNGRCNLTNMRVSPGDYNHPEFVAPIIGTHPAAAVLGFFDELGLLVREEPDGRVYPLSNSANTVLNVLRSACDSHGVEVRCSAEVASIEKSGEGFVLECTDGASATADKVVVATGGATDLLACAGHAIEPFQPVLCPLRVEGDVLRGTSGVRAKATVSAYRKSDPYEPCLTMEGEVQFKDDGLSGIVVFDMSRFVEEGDELGLDLCQSKSTDQLVEWMESRLLAMNDVAADHGRPQVSYADLMCGMLHPRLNDAVMRVSGARRNDAAMPDVLYPLACNVKDFRVRIGGKRDKKQAQVTRGGARCDEFDGLTLESRTCPGLFAAGEALDVDGRCGGFNLHWAWASGIAAGRAAAKRD